MGEPQSRSFRRLISAGLLMFGCVWFGLGIGLAAGQPSFGLFIGAGAGMVLVGVLIGVVWK
jgi:hypothetical protein